MFSGCAGDVERNELSGVPETVAPGPPPVNRDAQRASTKPSASDLEGARRMLDQLPIPIAAMPDGSGRYVMRDGSVSAFFHKDGFVLALAGGSRRADPSEHEDEEAERRLPETSGLHRDQGRSVYGLHWKFLGANSKAFRPDGELTTRHNHFTGGRGQWKTDVHTYGRMAWDALYPGIDMQAEAKSHGFEYRFIVAPGASVEAIQIQHEGADSIRVVDDGRSFEIDTGVGLLREAGLRCYQDAAGGQRDVACRFVRRASHTVGIAIEGTLDASRPLQIDPTISWSSYLGGGLSAAEDECRAVTVDASGNMYVVGFTDATTMFPISGGFQATNQGSFDAFVAKVNAAGALAWSSYLGGAGSDFGEDVAVDGSGNVYVTGYTNSATGFPTSGGFQATNQGSLDAFVAKVNAAGTLAWSSYLGGSGTDFGQGVGVDGSGNVYVTGYTDSATGFPTSGGFQTTFGGVLDAFVTKVNAAGGTLVWSSYLGGTGGDVGQSLAVDSSGNAYVTGYTDSAAGFPTSGGFQTTFGGVLDAFVTKVNAAGNTLAWSSYLGGSDDDRSHDVAVDGSGNIYATGVTQSSTGFPTSGGFQTTLGGSYDAFVTKVNAAGNTLVWSSYLGGTGEDIGRSVAVDGSGNVYVSGHTGSATGFPTNGGFQTTFGGVFDAFVTKVNAAGSTLVWSSYLGSADHDIGQGVAVDGSGNVYVCGNTSSATDFPTSGGLQTTYRGGNDGFVTKVNAAGNTLAWSSYVSGFTENAGSTVRDVAVGADGSVYLTGDSVAYNFPSNGGFQTSLSNVFDAFVTKVNAAGSALDWSSYLGGSNQDFGDGVAVDGSGNIYVTGHTYSSTDFPTNGGFQSTHGGSWDAFVTKVNATGGTVTWSSYLGGTNDDIGQSVAVDGSGNVYVTGYTDSATGFPTSGGFQTTLGGLQDAFVTKVNATGGTLAWSSYLGGTKNDLGLGVAVDGGGNVYLTGKTESATGFPTSGGFQTTLSGFEDAFVTKVNVGGSTLAWSSYLGGSGYEKGHGVAVDGSGNVYVTGDTQSLTGFPTSGGFQTTFGGSQDAFVTKVNAVGSTLAWSSFLGGSGYEEGHGVAVDSGGNVYVTGHTLSLTGFPTSGGFQTYLGGAEDAFVTKVNAVGSTIAWSSYLGGSSVDLGYGVAVRSGKVVVVGTTASTDFPAANAFTAALPGAQAGFVATILDLPIGHSCFSGAECASGFCVDGYCCDSACDAGGCDACNVPGVEGTCTTLAAGEIGACGPYLCGGGSPDCPSSCVGDGACSSGSYCDANSCVAKLDDGQTCSGANQCQSGNCAGSVCAVAPSAAIPTLSEWGFLVMSGLLAAVMGWSMRKRSIS